MIHGQRWGLYPDLNSSGSVQMGVDRWMLSQLSEEQPVLLRFYQWQQPTLSLGITKAHPPTVPAWASRWCADPAAVPLCSMAAIFVMPSP